MLLARNLNRLGTETAFDILARAAELQRAGQGHHQPRHRPARLQDARRISSRPRSRRCATAHHGYTPAQGILPLREAVAGSAQRRHGVEVDPDNVVIMPGGKPTMFFAILMFGAARRRDHVSGSRLPDLSLDDRVHRRQAGADRAAEENELRLHRRRGAGADHAEDAADHPQQSRQSDRRRRAEGRGREARRRPREASRTSRSCRTRSTARCSTTAASTTSFLRYPEIRDRLIMLDGWSKTYAMTGWRLGFSVWPQGAGREGRAAVRQLPLVRQRADAVRRHRRARRPAGRGAARWSRPSTSAAGSSCRC